MIVIIIEQKTTTIHDLVMSYKVDGRYSATEQRVVDRALIYAASKNIIIHVSEVV